MTLFILLLSMSPVLQNTETKSVFSRNDSVTSKIYPLIGYTATLDQNQQYFQSSFIGAGLKVHKKKLSFQVHLAAFYTSPPDFLKYQISSQGVLPGVGQELRNTHVFPYSDFKLSYTPNRIFQFEAGYGKQFLGYGYRSVLLSDHAPSGIFIKINTRLHKNILYENLFTRYTNDNAFSNSPFSRVKYVSSHTISFSILKKLQLTLLESVVWGAKDTLNHRSFDVNYLNPVVFYRPIEYSLGSSDNVLLGANLKIDLYKKNYLYGQLMLDEFLLREFSNQRGWWGNKYAIQTGFHGEIDYKQSQLELFVEYNRATPYTYSHLRSLESYSHQGQALAHPLGANFKEFLMKGQIKHKRHEWYMKYVYSLSGKDVNMLNYGSNILLPYSTRIQDYGISLLQGSLATLNRIDISYHYNLFPKIPLYVYTQATYRKYNINDTQSKNLLISIGIRTHLTRMNDDYF